jgi:hypothetical protein
MSGYDFDRPYVSQEALGVYIAIDTETAATFGAKVRAAILSNVEYKIRHERLKRENNMKPPPSCGRIFSGYLVVRHLGTARQYETWMPDHVFDELYRLDSGSSLRAKIVQPPRGDSGFSATTKNTDLNQRETLEEALLNLATLAGSEVVHKRQNARGTFFYEVQGRGFPSYQSATNTILELSRILCVREAAGGQELQ